MKEYLGLIIIALFILIVLKRKNDLKKEGIEAMEFGKKDKKDFLILPFALFYFYLLVANAFNLPTFQGQELFEEITISSTGVFVCMLALMLFIWTMISFKKSFRVGLVDNTNQGLITNGAFALSRNPIYLSFAMMLLGQFLIYPNWILLVYLLIAFFTFHRQVLKEEIFLEEQYGEEFNLYRKKVRRYF